jgi:signal transduction histidine kinase
MHQSIEGALPTAPSGGPIMVVDDDEYLREALVHLFEERGFRVAAFRDARDALAALESEQLPEVILLDLMMPHMDGWSFRLEQKRNQAWANIPVIAMSADPSSKAAAIDARAFLKKPLEFSTLVETVENVVRERQSERHRERTRELARLSSLGVLAAGVAHEINNPLAFVVGNLELAERQSSELEKRLSGAHAFSMVGIRQLLARAQRGAERITSVVRGISMFARPDDGELVEVDVADVLESSLQLVSNEIRHLAQLDRAYGATPPVLANAAQLGQVFLNLLLNALTALRERPQGEHRIRVATETGSDGGAVVTIEDTGSGIAPELLSRVFDPFLSTRSPGLGMGLGLSVARDVIAAMGGTIEVRSELHRGSTFRVSLPSSADSAHDDTSGVRVTPLPRAGRRSLRIMVVDDEPLICELLSTALSSYQVVTLTDAESALSQLLTDEHFDAVLCDLMMPGLSGMDLYERVVEQRPERARQFIFITGGPFTERARDFLTATRRPQVRKPFRQNELLDLIEAQLATKH